MGKYTVRTGEPGQELFRGPPERAPILGQKWVQNRAPFGGLPAQDGPKWGGFPLRTAGFFKWGFSPRGPGAPPQGPHFGASPRGLNPITAMGKPSQNRPKIGPILGPQGPPGTPILGPILRGNTTLFPHVSWYFPTSIRAHFRAPGPALGPCFRACSRGLFPITAMGRASLE